MQKRIILIIVALALGASTADASGFRGWRFGMSKSAVRAVRDCSPYSEVPQTGGLECKSFHFLKATINISFVFGPSGLRKIQIWAYTGQDVKTALARLVALRAHLLAAHGALTSPQLPNIGRMTRPELLGLLEQMRRSPSLVKYQLKPVTNPRGFFTFASLMHHPAYGFYIFLYVQPPRG